MAESVLRYVQNLILDRITGDSVFLSILHLVCRKWVVFFFNNLFVSHLPHFLHDGIFISYPET